MAATVNEGGFPGAIALALGCFAEEDEVIDGAEEKEGASWAEEAEAFAKDKLG
jgi:hypothetical protein